jgi:hypothetical protein
MNDVEHAASRLWSKLVGATETKAVGEEARQGVEAARVAAIQETEDLGRPSKVKFAKTTAAVAASAANALGEAKADMARATQVRQAKIEEAKAAGRGAIASSTEEEKEVVDAAKKAAALGDEFEAKADAKPTPMSDVEKALDQRFKKSDTMNRSIPDVLAERYQSLGQRDNTRLRGI